MLEETPGLTAVTAPKEPEAASVPDRLDRVGFPVQYESRKNHEILTGVFEFRAMGSADLHEVMLRRLRLTSPYEWVQLTQAEQALWMAVAHLQVALVSWPKWYDPDGKDTALGQDLYVGLFGAYAAWDAGLFRDGSEDRAGAKGKPVLVIGPAVGL